MGKNHSSASLFSSHDFYLFLGGGSLFHQGLAHPKTLSLYRAYSQISKRQRGTEVTQCEGSPSYSGALEGHRHCYSNGRTQLWGHGCQGRCSLELKPTGKAAIPTQKESWLLLSSREFPSVCLERQTTAETGQCSQESRKIRKVGSHPTTPLSISSGWWQGAFLQISEFWLGQKAQY